MIYWKTVVGFLAEADDELRVLHWRLHWLQFGEMREDCPQSDAAKYAGWFARLEEERTFDEGTLFESLAYVYNLLNWAWNCRRTPDDRLLCYTSRDERRWERFPRTSDFADLWPESVWYAKGTGNLPESCRKVNLTTVRLPVQMASRKLEILCWLVAKELGADSPLKVDRPARLKPEVGTEPLTEKDFAARMHRVYSEVNAAWNGRKDKTFVTGRRAILRRRCFSPDFGFCWPIM